MRGRLPGPRPLTAISGGAGRRAAREHPEGTPVAPEPPTHLRGVARATWARLAPTLYEQALLTDLDLDHFEAYCNAKADLVRYQRILDRRSDHSMKTPNGSKIQIPEVGMRNRALAQLQKLGEPLGLNPFIRQRMHIGGRGRSKAKRGPSLLTRRDAS